MMTLRRLHGLMTRALGKHVDRNDTLRAFGALAQRQREGGPSKLARRLSRKTVLGRAGAF